MAMERGLTAVAIAEHSSAHMAYGVRGERMRKLRAEVDRMNEKYADRIQVLLGVEGNLIGDGITDLPKGDKGLFDFLLLGYHRGVFPRDKISWRWAAASLFTQNPRKNAMAVAHALQKYPGVLAVTHPGLYIPMDIPTLAKACADYGAAFELNNAGGRVTLDVVREAAKVNGLKFLLSSDAHKPEDVGHVENALAVAREAELLPRVINWRMDGE